MWVLQHRMPGRAYGMWQRPDAAARNRRNQEEECKMTREELKKRLESAEKQMLGLQDEIQNLKEKLAEAQDEPEIPDFPVFCVEPLYFVNSRSEIVGDEYRTCTGIVAHGFNAFHSKEYAQEFADKCKLIAMMLHCKWYLCRGFKGDYSDSSDKWVVYYGGLDDKFIATNSIHCDYGFVPFDTMDNAQKCADWLNEHWRGSE
jgi:hypothetical protein